MRRNMVRKHLLLSVLALQQKTMKSMKQQRGKNFSNRKNKKPRRLDLLLKRRYEICIIVF